MFEVKGKSILVFCCFVMLFVWNGCQDDDVYIEVPETLELTQTSVRLLSEVISTFDVIQDFVSTEDVFYKKEESLIPSSVNRIVVDSTFADGDGVLVKLDFGVLGEAPIGVLCKDDKYRVGIIEISLDKPLTEQGATLAVTFPYETPFYSGDGVDMSRITGELEMKALGTDRVSIVSEGLVFVDFDYTKHVKFDMVADIVIDNGASILNDSLRFDGKLSVATADEEVEFSITDPLVKQYSPHCARFIKSGQMDVSHSISKSAVSVDFDHNAQQKCDNEVSILINGKQVIFTY